MPKYNSLNLRWEKSISFAYVRYIRTRKTLSRWIFSKRDVEGCVLSKRVPDKQDSKAFDLSKYLGYQFAQISPSPPSKLTHVSGLDYRTFENLSLRLRLVIPTSRCRDTYFKYGGTSSVCSFCGRHVAVQSLIVYWLESCMKLQRSAIVRIGCRRHVSWRSLCGARYTKA